ncbi:MAG: hemerythrin domain-containing protein [Acidobacteria bacterium]|nr:hemerythrin domain-containing protein [Acidobacteriota bacterium]
MTDISEFMSQDHDRLDAIFANFRKNSAGGQAKQLFSQFESGLRAHIAWEEEILFPPFEERIGMRDSGPTAVMRVEHRRIKELLRSIRDGIDGGRQVFLRVPETGRLQPITIKDRTGVDASANDLKDVLQAHNHKEAQILYLWLERTLADGERSALLGRIQSLPGMREN